MKTDIELRKQKDFYNKSWEKERNFPDPSDKKCRYNTIFYCLKKINLPQNPRILDAGCGLGRLANKLSKFGEVTGIDLSDKTIENNKRIYPHIHWTAGDILNQNTPINKNYYDLVVSSEVIEHIPYNKQQNFIKRIHESLIKDGYLILTTPNKQTTDKFGIKGCQPIEDFLTIDDLRTLLIGYFNILKIYTTYFFATNKILWMIFGKGFPLYLHTIEPVMRKTRGGLYIVCLAKKVEWNC